MKTKPTDSRISKNSKQEKAQMSVLSSYVAGEETKTEAGTGTKSHDYLVAEPR